jgi:hypothetical protein
MMPKKPNKSEPTQAAINCAVMVAAWTEWAKQCGLPRSAMAIRTGARGEMRIDLIKASEKALAAFRAQHGGGR